MRMSHEGEYICVCERWDEPVLYPVAELIRCRECMHYDADNFQCETDKPHSGTWFPESYCDRAEKKEPNTHE